MRDIYANTGLTARGEHTVTALFGISCAGLGHLFWGLFFDNPLDLPALFGTVTAVWLMLAVLVAPCLD